jgi:hypothetical protein
LPLLAQTSQKPSTCSRTFAPSPGSLPSSIRSPSLCPLRPPYPQVAPIPIAPAVSRRPALPVAYISFEFSSSSSSFWLLCSSLSWWIHRLSPSVVVIPSPPAASVLPSSVCPPSFYPSHSCSLSCARPSGHVLSQYDSPHSARLALPPALVP